MKALFTISLLGLSLSSWADSTLLINEVDSDNTGTDTAEFIELYDGGTGNISLNGHVVVLFNGFSDQSYLTIDLSGHSTDAQGYFVICGDAANVAGCDLDISPDSDLIQNGADAVALYQAAAADFPNNTAVTTTNLIDALVYDTDDNDDSGLLVLLNAGQPQINENANSDKDNQSLQRCENGAGGARNSAGFISATPTPGAASACNVVVEPVLGNCGETSQPGFRLISAVQGNITDVSADASPLLGETVIVEGIVTLDKQGGLLANGDSSYQYSGFWLQEEDTDADNDAMTSEGIFIYDYKNAVNSGDKVRVMAKVAEYQQVTQLKNVQELVICSSANALPAAVTVTLPVDNLQQLEALEGMRINSSQNLIVSDLFGTGYGFGNYGQFVVSSALHFQSTEIAAPQSAEAQAAIAARALDVLLIDDGVSAAYPAFIPFPDDSGFSALNPLRIGDSVSTFDGVMHAYKNNYTVIPSALTIDPTHPRTAAPTIAADANLVIVGMNVLNYFNGDGQGGGFPTSRGAKTYDAFTMQSDKIVAALTAMNADIIGLMEIENDGFGEHSAIQTLVNELNKQQTAGNEYSLINPGVSTIGSDAITVGLIYRAGKVTAVGTAAILDSSNSAKDENDQPLFLDTKNRPALIQSFSMNDEVFTVAVNHLKSKGSACNEDNEGADGQGNCNQTRNRAAQALVQYLATQPTGVNSSAQLVLGDLNAYSKEDPINTILDAGFSNLKYSEKSTETQPYSYSFGGFLGSLDHALATADFYAHVVSVDAWHINSVEDSLMDYETEATGQDYDSIDNYANADAYRSSDHDPIVVALRIDKKAPEPDPENPDNGSDNGDNNNSGDNNDDDNNGGPLHPLTLLVLAMIAALRRRG